MHCTNISLQLQVELLGVNDSRTDHEMAAASEVCGGRTVLPEVDGDKLLISLKKYDTAESKQENVILFYMINTS